MLKISIIPVIIFILRFPISLSRADTGNNSFHNPFQVRIRFNERPEFRIFSRPTSSLKLAISVLSARGWCSRPFRKLLRKWMRYLQKLKREQLTTDNRVLFLGKFTMLEQEWKVESRFNRIAIKLGPPRSARSPSNTTANGIPVNEVYRLICEFRVTFVRNRIGNEIPFLVRLLNIENVLLAELRASFVPFPSFYLSVNYTIVRLIEENKYTWTCESPIIFVFRWTIHRGRGKTRKSCWKPWLRTPGKRGLHALCHGISLFPFSLMRKPRYQIITFGKSIIFHSIKTLLDIVLLLLQFLIKTKSIK